MTGIYAEWAPVYRRAGFEPRPIRPGTKACHLANWQAPMTEESFRESVGRFGSYGIGLLMGSSFPDGTTLAALDVDDDAYVRVAELLMGQPRCIRRGRRGVIIFCRIRGPARNLEFRDRGKQGTGSKVCELLAVRKLAVIPPTIHPDTGSPYAWRGPALHELSFEDLPILEAAS